MKPTDEELFIREFILQFKLGVSHPAYYREKFGEDIREKFAEPLQRIREWGYLKEGDDPLRLTRDGLLEVDRLLHEFFLPRHQKARYA